MNINEQTLPRNLNAIATLAGVVDNQWVEVGYSSENVEPNRNNSSVHFEPTFTSG